MSDFVLSQLLIGVVLFIDIAAFQFKERRKVLLCLSAAAFLYGVHYWLLQIHTAAVLGFLASLRFTVARYSTSKKWLLLFLPLVFTNALFTYSGILTLLGTVAATVSTTASFLGTDRLLRLGMMCATTIWIVHNVIAQTPAAAALEVVFLAGNIIGYYRYYGRQSVD